MAHSLDQLEARAHQKRRTPVYDEFGRVVRHGGEDLSTPNREGGGYKNSRQQQYRHDDHEDRHLEPRDPHHHDRNSKPRDHQNQEYRDYDDDNDDVSSSKQNDKYGMQNLQHVAEEARRRRMDALWKDREEKGMDNHCEGDAGFGVRDNNNHGGGVDNCDYYGHNG